MNFFKLIVCTSLFLFAPLMCNAQIKISGGADLPRVVAPQDTLDYTIIRCEYTQWVVQDTLQPKKWTKDRMLLQIGSEISKFFNYSNFINDSISRKQILEGLSLEKIVNSGFGRARGKINYEIFRGYPQRKNTYIGNMSIDYFLYEEDVKKPEWELLPDTLTILGYLCKKATCTFHCREYTAWYAPEIPISEGPWKLTGLPGLILKAYDKKRQIQFDAVAIEKVEWMDPIIHIRRNRLQKTSKAKFQKAYADYMKNPATIDQQYIISSSQPARNTSKPYNPIELCE